MEPKKIVLDQLDEFVKEYECRIDRLLECFKWSKESVLNSTAAGNDDEKEKRKPNTTVDEFPPSFQPTDSSTTICLDNVKQAEAILEGVYQNPSFELGVSLEQLVDRDPPTSIADLHVNFTRDERLSIYQHVLNNTSKPPNVPEIKIRFKRDGNSEEKPTSLPEIAAIERDARRRNPKHRVSRNPLTYTEEVRHLIQVQTDALANHFRHSSRTTEGDVRARSEFKSKDVHQSRSKSPRTERSERSKRISSKNRQRSRSKSSVPDRSNRSEKTKAKHLRRSRSISPAHDRSHKKRTRYRSRSRERSRSRDRKRHKAHRKERKKQDQ